VNVEVFNVEGVIDMLKVALIAVLMTTPVAFCAGATDTTDGTVTVSWPHPAMNATRRVTIKEVIPALNMRIVLPRPTVLVWRKQFFAPGATDWQVGIKR
jgi:hypothetical protein